MTGGGGRVNNYRDNKNCTWFAIIISRALESNKTCSLRVVPCGRERGGRGGGKGGCRLRERTWQHSGARTPNLLNFLAPTGAAIQSALCTLHSSPSPLSRTLPRNVMKQSFIKIHYLFNTQLASPSYLPLPLSPPSLAPAQKANKINLRLRRTENKSQRQRGPHLPARGVE